MASRIPVIDFSTFGRSDESRKSVAEKLNSAFETVGFCVAIGHGISKEASARIRRAALDFFDRSLEEKCTLANDAAGNRGTYGKRTPYTYKAERGAQLLGDFSAKSPDLVEALSVFPTGGTSAGPEDGISSSRSTPGTEGQPRIGQDSSLWPGFEDPELPAHLPQQLQDEIKAYTRELANFGSILAECAAEALACDDNNFFKRNCSPAWGLRMAHYMDEGSSENVAPGQLRYGAHVDSYGITLLEPDPIHWRGLQVLLPKAGARTIVRDSLESIINKEEDGEWVDVPFVEGCLILNVGALLSRWTGNAWKANVHRVVYHPGRRLALVSSALHPQDDVVIQPIATSVTTSAWGQRSDLHESSVTTSSGGKSTDPCDGFIAHEEADGWHCTLAARSASRNKLYPPITCKEFIADRMKVHSEDKPSSEAVRAK